jgi:predicted nucleic acid-binding protein
VRAVVDPNLLISALLSREGSPARVLRAWLEGAFELIVSEDLLGEIAGASHFRSCAHA